MDLTNTYYLPLYLVYNAVTPIDDPAFISDKPLSSTTALTAAAATAFIKPP